ncbi:uncharacterized protein EKO05_0002081 [Ascochyta rabiei]|uniref:Uncharacterized protein n=1 Tax=Didymella rabiei TaxID=5454 RepID=A0A163C2I4_DIDRA|nr:uncharacterized protein EKO05_0002081 [Ascochyta rabiei]KZM22168.1 hypothetical protein ST47_g6646 [Ascochyta rabiei]UPX11475.1 hypothetical protein EKO05_0002081 [Ascochyta rabiei]
MPEHTEAQEMRLDRHRKLQNGMELILGKLKHNAKGITAEDARSLADNAEDGDEWAASIVTAVEDVAARNEAEGVTVDDDHSRSTDHTSQSALNVSQNVIQRLRSDPSSITEEDARRFSENVKARDASSARLVSAVESLAAAHNDIYGQRISLGQIPHPSLLTVVKDLYAAVETNPEDINMEILRTTQSIVSKMQKAIGHTNAPHPELEAELQQEYAKIVPKVERGIVTKAEADHLHSLEARAHGHTERGGLTAIAQSVAARHERRGSVSSSTGNVRSRASSRTFMPHEQPYYDTEVNPSKVEAEEPRTQNSAGTRFEADDLGLGKLCSSREGAIAAAAQSITSTRRLQSLSDSTNTTRASIEDLRKHSSMTSKLAGLSVHDEEDGISRYDITFPKLQSPGSGDKRGSGSENMLRAHKRENGESAI